MGWQTLAAVDAANAVDAVAGRLEFPREMAALDLRGAQLADALGNAPAFDVIGIVGDLRAVVVPIGETADRRRYAAAAAAVNPRNRRCRRWRRRCRSQS